VVAVLGIFFLAFKDRPPGGLLDEEVKRKEKEVEAVGGGASLLSVGEESRPAYPFGTGPRVGGRYVHGETDDWPLVHDMVAMADRTALSRRRRRIMMSSPPPSPPKQATQLAGPHSARPR